MGSVSKTWLPQYQKNFYRINIGDRTTPRVEINQVGRSLSYKESFDDYDGVVFAGPFILTGLAVLRRLYGAR